MTQLELPMNAEKNQFDDYLLISVLPRYYRAIFLDKTKKFEFRRGRFIDKAVRAFVYSTLSKSKEDSGSPSGEIGGLVTLGTPVIGIEEVIQTKEIEEAGSRKIMQDWLKGFSTASAHPIEDIKRFEKPVTLTEMREKFPNFQPPQKYLLLNHKQEMLEFLKQRCGIVL